MTKTERTILAAYLQQGDSGRFTSQDICDNLRETCTLTVDTVTEYMLEMNYRLGRDDDRLVWVIR